MNKKQYIKPSVLVLPISATNIICQSEHIGRGEGEGTNTPEARRRIVEDEEDDDSWNW
ncbi:MAG: hypothetical protein J6035_08345 [Bacteroidaceae bacterium]|nr:hypothetical protein [Bacteroidaceae bacterium]